RVRPDQLFNVEHIAILWIFGAGAGPEQPLALRALSGKSFPARGFNHLLVIAISLLGVGDGNLAAQRLEELCVGSLGGFETLFDDGVHQSIDSADKEAGHTGDTANILVRLQSSFQAIE